jgi:protein-S-isoprenylcysteine O-methyltransferase Ste14
MARRILSAAFWCFALFLTVHGVRAGGRWWAVPGAVVAASAAFAADLWLHRRLVRPDRALARAGLHLLSAVAVASACMVWLLSLLWAGLG